MSTNSRNIRADEVDDDDETVKTHVLQHKKPYHHYQTTYTSTRTDFYLCSGIGEPGLYVDIFHTLLAASPNDVIYIHLNTDGGSLSTGIQLINAMTNSQAKIVTCLEGNAFSLGTLIFLCGDEMVVNDHSMMMFHDYSGGVGGKGSEQASQITATRKWFAQLLKQVYVPFLSQEEVDRILRGEDIWMAAPEINARLNKMVKALSAQAKTTTKKAPKQPSS